MGWVLEGALAEPSGFSATGEFYIWHVRLPLFTPHDVLDLTFSERVGGGTATYTDSNPEEVRQALAPVLQAPALADEQVLPWLLSGPLENIRWTETTAYAAVYLGDITAAESLLLRVAEHEPTYDWQSDMVQRAAAMRELLRQDDLPNARRRIESWRGDTCRALGVD